MDQLISKAVWDDKFVASSPLPNPPLLFSMDDVFYAKQEGRIGHRT